jgi:RNA polymerase sigma-70 factor, ECF subfamily
LKTSPAFEPVIFFWATLRFVCVLEVNAMICCLTVHLRSWSDHRDVFSRREGLGNGASSRVLPDALGVLWTAVRTMVEETGTRPGIPLALRQDIIDAQRGDLHACARLIDLYHPRIARLVYAILLNTADVDDVTQQIFVRMCQRIASLRDPDLFEPWLHRLARRLSLDYLRREKFRRFWSPLEALFGQVEERAPAAPEHAASDYLRDLLAMLSASDRELILLAGEGHTYEEIAMFRNKSRASVKARIARVREWLRTQIAEEKEPR